MTEIYNGSKNNEGIPNGQGTKISKESDGKITCIEEGIWENGFLVKGSNTSYLDSHILKEVGEWKLFEGGKNCSEFLSGYGEELYFSNDKDLKENKPFGHVKGLFDEGNLLEGEILEPSLTGYTELKGIKKIIYKKSNIREMFLKEININTKLKLGEIFYDDGCHYEGELDFDSPFGKGTMTLPDGRKKTCEWYNGNIKE